MASVVARKLNLTGVNVWYIRPWHRSIDLNLLLHALQMCACCAVVLIIEYLYYYSYSSLLLKKKLFCLLNFVPILWQCTHEAPRDAKLGVCQIIQYFWWNYFLFVVKFLFCFSWLLVTLYARSITLRIKTGCI